MILRMQLALIAALFSFTVHAQQGGIVNAAGQWAQNIGTIGANANRIAANNLYKQGLQDEAQGLATMNIGQLSKALTEGLSGVQADDQSKHLGQTAMQALQSGSDAGNLNLSQYGTSQDQIKDFANNYSPMAPQANSQFAAFGIQVDHSSSLLKTPFGDYSLDTSIDTHAGQLAAYIGQVATSHGYSAADVANGVKSGLATRDQIAQDAMAEAQRQAKAIMAGGAPDNGVTPTAPTVAATDANAGKATDRGPASVPTDLGANTKVSGKGFDMAERSLELNKSREEMMKKLGTAYQQTDAIGDQTMGLFAIVHSKYQEMRHAGHFNEGSLLAALPLH